MSPTPLIRSGVVSVNSLFIDLLPMRSSKMFHVESRQAKERTSPSPERGQVLRLAAPNLRFGYRKIAYLRSTSLAFIFLSGISLGKRTRRAKLPGIRQGGALAAVPSGLSLADS